ncbi:MAG: hypothetical protein ACI8RD_014461 [Bacillariaceae sp.]|jgi:hypothetical protein
MLLHETTTEVSVSNKKDCHLCFSVCGHSIVVVKVDLINQHITQHFHLIAETSITPSDT